MRTVSRCWGPIFGQSTSTCSRGRSDIWIWRAVLLMISCRVRLSPLVANATMSTDLDLTSSFKEQSITTILPLPPPPIPQKQKVTLHQQQLQSPPQCLKGHRRQDSAKRSAAACQPPPTAGNVTSASPSPSTAKSSLSN